MSALSLDPPTVATYDIDPDKQCGVVRFRVGNRCTINLSCRIHNEADKRAVERSKPYQRLLREQLRFPAPYFHQAAHGAGHPILAPVLDPDMHCGVVLPTGQPCMQDLISCDAHKTRQQLRVPGRSARLADILRVNRANASLPRWNCGDEHRQFNPDTDCGVKKPNGEHCQVVLSCIVHSVEDKKAVRRHWPFEHRFDTLLRLQLARTAFIPDAPAPPSGAPSAQHSRTESISTTTAQEMQNPFKEQIKKLQEGPERNTEEEPPATPAAEAELATASPGTDELWWRHTARSGQDDRKDHILSEHYKTQEEHSRACPPAPRWPADRRSYAASPNHTSTAPSPNIPRGNVSPLSLDTSDDEQFTPTSSRDSLYACLRDEKHEHKSKAWEADSTARETQLQQAGAELYDDGDAQDGDAFDTDAFMMRMDKMSEKLAEVDAAYSATLNDREMRRNDKLVYEQDCENRRKAQLYDQDTETRRNEKLVYEQHCESRRNEQLVYDQHLENHRNEQLLRDQDKEIRHNAMLLCEQDKEHRLKAQLRFDEDRAELDRLVRAQQMTDDEVTRLRTRAQRADELEQAMDVQHSQKTSMLQSIKDLKVGLKFQETCYQNELTFNASQTNALEVQIQDLQQSMEVLVTEKIDATARYQQGKAVKEAKINQLQEKISALE